MSEQVTESPRDTQKRVRLRPETERKLAAITAHMRWTDTEAIDAMCDEFMGKRRISVTEAAQPTTAQKNNNDSELIRSPIDQSPTEKPVSDMKTEDVASTNSTAGKPEKNANSDQAQAKSA